MQTVLISRKKVLVHIIGIKLVIIIISYTVSYGYSEKNQKRRKKVKQVCVTHLNVIVNELVNDIIQNLLKFVEQLKNFKV